MNRNNLLYQNWALNLENFVPGRNLENLINKELHRLTSLLPMKSTVCLSIIRNNSRKYVGRITVSSLKINFSVGHVSTDPLLTFDNLRLKAEAQILVWKRSRFNEKLAELPIRMTA